MGEGLSKSPSITKSLTKTCNWVASCKQHVRAAYPNKGQAGFKIFLALGPVSWKARKLFWPVGKFKIKTCSMVAQFFALKPVNFALLTDSFIVSFSKLLKLWSWMQTRRTQNRFPGPKSYRDFRKRAPVEHDINIKGFRKGSSMDYFNCIMSPLKRQHIANIVLFVNNFLRFLINCNWFQSLIACTCLNEFQRAPEFYILGK